MQVDNLILDMGNDFVLYRERVLPVLEDDFEDFTKELVKTILEFVQKAAEGQNMLQDMADQLQQIAREQGHTNAEVQILKDACLDLGVSIFENLMNLGAYDAEGFLGFKYGQILGTDLVLHPLTPEDLAEMDEGDTATDFVDPNAVAERREAEDLANFYAGNPYDQLLPEDDDSEVDD